MKLKQYPGRFLGIIRIKPRVSKSRQLYVVMFQFFFTKMNICSIDSSKLSSSHELQPATSHALITPNFLSDSNREIVGDYV